MCNVKIKKKKINYKLLTWYEIIVEARVAAAPQCRSAHGACYY
jgi:hypothetical protein